MKNLEKMLRKRSHISGGGFGGCLYVVCGFFEKAKMKINKTHNSKEKENRLI